MSLSIKGLGIRLFNWMRLILAAFSFAPFTGEAYDEAMGRTHTRAKVFSGFDIAGVTPLIYRGAQMKAAFELQGALA